MRCISIRGAITAKANTREAMLEATRTLVQAIIEANQIDKKQIIQILFTATKDLDAVYPAVAARELGITEAALMCMQELSVEDSLSMCIRVAVLIESEVLTRKTVKHQYLEGAKVLRPDLAKGEKI
ncbi:chorismate mutase [Sporanaerobium hydrogeniformans]|uniref:Chorismate mutase n=1 Tax=Sporanaerobium hydrogeniformans TaxID=3072179 RepID=A0AC61DCW5_9FIRM|nr:chorismate mutase [Sporanaerobium hydrogeniformans]PHV71164.1 chorismate mutase [Sporanaerobium hydrogeniformans]